MPWTFTPQNNNNRRHRLASPAPLPPQIWYATTWHNVQSPSLHSKLMTNTVPDKLTKRVHNPHSLDSHFPFKVGSEDFALLRSRVKVVLMQATLQMCEFFSLSLDQQLERQPKMKIQRDIEPYFKVKKTYFIPLATVWQRLTLAFNLILANKSLVSHTV